jgi:hypothetical protein
VLILSCAGNCDVTGAGRALASLSRESTIGARTNGGGCISGVGGGGVRWGDGVGNCDRRIFVITLSFLFFLFFLITLSFYFLITLSFLFLITLSFYFFFFSEKIK